MKKDIVKEFQERAGISSQKDAAKYWNTAWQMLIDHLADEDGFAPYVGIKFKTAYRSARNGHNPYTGETMKISERYIPKVHFSKTIRDAVNEAVIAASI